MSEYRCPTARDWTIVAVAIAAFTAASLLIVLAGIPRFGLVAGVVAIVAALLALVRWHAWATAYRCQECDHEFRLSTMQDLLAPNMLTEKLVRCPACGRRTWASTLVRDRRSRGSG
jgi:DNA-directed RNA polymerase subunit RPC12/RpoP